MSKIYRLFVSHSWNYSDNYNKVIDFIRKQKIVFYNHSVPKNDPINTNGTDLQLKNAIEAKMKGTSCIILLAGLYARYSKWINKEIEIAQLYNKPIIAIEHWGSERTSEVIKKKANRIVKWNGSLIASAIRELG